MWKKRKSGEVARENKEETISLLFRPHPPPLRSSSLSHSLSSSRIASVEEIGGNQWPNKKSRPLIFKQKSDW